MTTVCKQNKCVGCYACFDICSKNAIKINRGTKSYNAVINENLCNKCNACKNVCQINNPIELIKPISWYQGWTNNKAIRESGSSGGIAGAISSAFLKKGGYLCSCTFKNGEFVFKITDKENELKNFSGSKYIKSCPKGIYSTIAKLLKNNKEVLFIGLPCQAAALKKFVPAKLQENLYTADLICHGTPSPKLLDIFLDQYNIDLKQSNSVEFRRKGLYQVFNNKSGVDTTGVCDRYLISFLNSLIHTDNCYECPYAKTQRISDLTLGDSWGSKLPYVEIKKGISLILCQTEKGNKLLHNADLHLENVDIENAINNNGQLKHPSVPPKKREEFFNKLEKGKSFNSLILNIFPKKCIKQSVKKILIKIGIF